MAQNPSTRERRAARQATETVSSETPSSEQLAQSISAPTEERSSRISPGSIGGLSVFQPSTMDVSAITMMIYGDSGAGKTRLAGTAAQIEAMSPVLVLDVEGGSLTLKGLFDNDPIDILSIPSWPKLQAVYDDLYRGRHPYKTVVVDSGSESQKLALLHAMEGTKAKMPDSPDPVSFDTEKLPEIKDWYRNSEQMRRFIRGFRDLPINTIFTALAMDKDVGNVTTKWPLFTNKLSEEIPGLVSTVYYMYVKETRDASPNQRHLLTDKTTKALAKSRIHGLDTILSDPHMEQIYNKLVTTRT